MQTKRDSAHRQAAPAARLLLAIAGVAAVILVFEVLRTNVSASHLEDWPWRWEFLGAPSAAAIMVFALTAWVARDQYARSVAPTLRSVSQWSERPEFLGPVSPRFRQVVLCNTGPGTAIVRNVAWRVATSDREVGVASMEELRAYLTELDLADGRDYAITNVTSGASLSPGEEHLYYECTEAALSRFRVFEAEFEFESLVGDRFSRPVSLLPYPGSSKVAVKGATASR